MQKKYDLRLMPYEAAHEQDILLKIAATAAVPLSAITGFQVLKKSIDARGRQILINLSVLAYINEPFFTASPTFFSFKSVEHSKKRVVIIGAGPAGIFAALKLLEAGIKPIILERGQDVKSRRRDLAALNRSGIVNPESNYCFGEGGAGTYSDGKLYTRSNKRGNLNRILELFVHFGAAAQILYESHPHIGTNKLPQIITAMRQQIIDCGGEVHFEKKCTGFIHEKGSIIAVETACQQKFQADAFILATGHSARDIFTLLHHQGILIEAKPFALGVRIEHPQELINNIQYHGNTDMAFLPPAPYSVVAKVQDTSAFSFCMCPGGIIAPAATAANELVVNGWSPSKRNNPFANSGIVVPVETADVIKYLSPAAADLQSPLLFMHFQQMVEQKAFTAGGGNLRAPAQRLTDFCNNKLSASLPENSYLPGLQSSALKDVLPGFIYNTLVAGFRNFGKKMKGYYTEEAVVVATESRTSSPVRIPRNEKNLHHPQFHNLYPCGEGAGYAGGIVSAAMDGERIAAQITCLYA
jgi:uncharacterized FAD-dependent dehydrogenase